MRKCVESHIEFDFSSALNVFEHDTTKAKCEGDSSADGNTFWPGVDFRVEDIDGWIWIELKNWRGKMRGSFQNKMRSRAFGMEMCSKFLGTTSYLAWNGQFAQKNVRYVLLFEPPSTSDAALLAAFQDIVRAHMSVPRRLKILVFVWDIATWNSEFPTYPARKLR